MKFKYIKLEKVNGKIVALFLFQYSLLIPLMSYINPSVLVATMGLILSVVYIYLNVNNRINNNNIIFLLFLTIIVVIKSLSPAQDYYLIFYFFTIVYPVFLIFFYKFDSLDFFNMGYKLAFLNILINFINPFTTNYEYMRFGYGMVLTPIFVFIKHVYFSNGKSFFIKLLNIFVILISCIEIIVYGARGASLILLFFFLMVVFWLNKKYGLLKFVFFTLMIIFYYNINFILNLLNKLTNSIGVNSYALYKFKLQLDEGVIIASSGRNLLYEESIKKISDKLFFGNSIQTNTDLYVHNIFLQILQDLGIFALISLLLFLFILLLKIRSENYSKEDKLVIVVFLSLAMGRLIISSIYWKRPEFWMLICTGLLFLKIKKVRHIYSSE